MIDPKYIYILSEVVFVIGWLLIFFYFKRIRNEIFWVSLFYGISAFFQEPFYVIDWWHPQTITHTKFGVEDFLFTFAAGVICVFYEIIFRKRLAAINSSESKKSKAKTSVLIFILLMATSFFIFKLNSFFSSTISFTVATLYLLSYRKDLIPVSLFTGAIAVPIGMSWFKIVEKLSPGWVASTWYMDKLSGVIIAKGPLEDFIWAFLSSAYISIIYKVWTDKRLVNLEKKIN